MRVKYLEECHTHRKHSTFSLNIVLFCFLILCQAPMLGHWLHEVFDRRLQRNAWATPEVCHISAKFSQGSRRYNSGTHDQYYFIAPFIKEV